MQMQRLLLLAAASTSFLFAQEITIWPFPVSDVSPELRQYLNLTDAQANALRDVRKSKEDAERAVYEQARQKQNALDQLLNSNSADYTQIGRLTVEIRDLYKKLPVSGEPYRTQALNVLNQEQRNRLPALTAALLLQTAAYDATNFSLIDLPNVPGRPVPLTGSAPGASATAP